MNELFTCKNSNESMTPVSDPGLYGVSKDTLDVLKEVSRLLDRFKCELFYGDTQGEKVITDPCEPKSFTENTLYNLEFAIGIRNDLKMIMGRFIGGPVND